MSWTDERIESLKALYADGLSSSQIAIEMGQLTRNAVIGKVSRLGLTRDGHPSTAPKTRHPKHRPTRTEKFKPHVRLTNHGNRFDMVEVNTPPPLPDADDSAIPIEQRRTLLELENRHCRWPVGNPSAPDFFFCGHPSADAAIGIPYCAAHGARAFAGRGKAYDRYPAWGRGRA